MVSPEAKPVGLPLALSEIVRAATVRYYDIGEVSRWRNNTRGLVNRSFEIDNRFFLTIYKNRTREELEADAQIANNMDTAIPIARPKRGREGYSLQTLDGPILLTPKLPGIHFVGTKHTDKHPIPEALHSSLATFYWRLQEGLSSAPDDLKAQLTNASRETIGKMPERIPEIAKPLEKYAPFQGIPAFKYPDLIHDDLERQNILSVDGEITGVVDLDSIRSGDILYEFGHFLFNNVFCDPQATRSTAMFYIDTLKKAGIIRLEDIPSIYGHIYRFAVSDIVDFEDLRQNFRGNPDDIIDIKLLVKQYERALGFAADVFDIQSVQRILFDKNVE